VDFVKEEERGRTTTAPTWLSIGAADKRRSVGEKVERSIIVKRKEMDIHACSRAADIVLD
jgi:hypothetical protein